MATSYKLGIVKLAHREESFYLISFKKVSNKNYVGLLEGNINAIRNFCPSCLISENSVPLARKEAKKEACVFLYMSVFVQHLFFVNFVLRVIEFYANNINARIELSSIVICSCLRAYTCFFQ